MVHRVFNGVGNRDDSMNRRGFISRLTLAAAAVACAPAVRMLEVEGPAKLVYPDWAPTIYNYDPVALSRFMDDLLVYGRATYPSESGTIQLDQP